MNQYNNGGSSSHEAAAKHYSSSSYYTALLSHSEACIHLQALGFDPANLASRGSGRLDIEGRRKGNRSGAFQWTDDGQALHWINFITDKKGTIFADQLAMPDKAVAARLFQQAEDRRRKQEAERQTRADFAARCARDLYHSGVSSNNHEYLRRKQLTGSYNTRLQSSTGALMIPMRVSNAELVNLQFIYPNGTKRFMRNARVKGTYSLIGSLNRAEHVLICEGWSTGASLFELKGLPVVVAFSAGNLMSVCQSLRSKFENISIVIAADDDRQNTVNIGRRKAIEAAKSIGATLLFPELCKACKCSDWNDLSICKQRRTHG